MAPFHLSIWYAIALYTLTPSRSQSQSLRGAQSKSVRKSACTGRSPFSVSAVLVDLVDWPLLDPLQYATTTSCMTACARHRLRFLPPQLLLAVALLCRVCFIAEFSAAAASPLLRPPRWLPPIDSSWHAPPTVDPWLANSHTTDAPYLGNGDLGVLLSADLTASPSSRATVIFYIGLNQFWAVNQTDVLYPPNVWPDIQDPLLPGLATLARVNITLPPVSPGAIAAPLNFSAQQDIYRGWTHVQLVDSRDGKLVLQLDSTLSTGDSGNILMTNVTLGEPAATLDSSVNLIVSTVTVSWTVDGHIFPTTAGCSGVDGRSVDCQQASSRSAGALAGDYITRLLNFNEQDLFPLFGALATRVVAQQPDDYRLINSSTDSTLAVSSWLSVTAGRTVTVVSVALTNLDVIGMDHSSPSPPVPAPIESPLPQLLSRLSALTWSELIRLTSRRLSFWHQFFYEEGSAVYLPSLPVLQSWWYGANALLGSSMRVGSVSPGLWGPFIYNDDPGWHSDYTTDYNHESFVWGLYSSNRATLASASYPVILQYLPRSIFGAAYFNCTKISSYYPSHIAAFGLPASVGPAGDLGLKYLAGFLSLNLIAHFEYTQDEPLLRDTLYPWLRLQMNWYEWLLLKQPLPDGGYRYVDPDDCNLEVCSSSKGQISSLNGAEPLSVIRRVMTATVAFAQHLGVDQSSLPLWQDMLQHWSDYPTAQVQYGEANITIFTFSEDSSSASTPDFHDSTGQWNTLLMFPCEDVGLHSSPALVSTSLATLTWMGFEGDNSFPFIFPAAARVGYPADLILQAYNSILASVFPSYYYYEYGGGLETAGSIEGVNSMLLQSNEFAIALFPVWPANTSAAFIELRAKGAFLLSSRYNASSTQGISVVLVHSEAGLPCSMLDPWQYSQQQKQDKLWRRYQQAISGPAPPTSPRPITADDTPHSDLVVLQLSEHGSSPVPVVWSSAVPNGYYEIDPALPEAFFTFSTDVNATYAVLLNDNQHAVCELLPLMCDWKSGITRSWTRRSEAIHRW